MDDAPDANKENVDPRAAARSPDPADRLRPGIVSYFNDAGMRTPSLSPESDLPHGGSPATPHDMPGMPTPPDSRSRGVPGEEALSFTIHEDPPSPSPARPLDAASSRALQELDVSSAPAAASRKRGMEDASEERPEKIARSDAADDVAERIRSRVEISRIANTLRARLRRAAERAGIVPPQSDVRRVFDVPDDMRPWAERAGIVPSPSNGVRASDAPARASTSYSSDPADPAVGMVREGASQVVQRNTLPVAPITNLINDGFKTEVLNAIDPGGDRQTHARSSRSSDRDLPSSVYGSPREELESSWVTPFIEAENRLARPVSRNESAAALRPPAGSSRGR